MNHKRWWIFFQALVWSKINLFVREGLKPKELLVYFILYFLCASFARCSMSQKGCILSETLCTRGLNTAITSALSFASLLPLSQPSSPDKKDPLLRCFARHYKTVAMDTRSEQAPHTGCRIGNDRCNTSHLKFPSSSCQHMSWWSRLLKNAKDQDPNRTCPWGFFCCCCPRSSPHLLACGDYLLLAPQRWAERYFPPHLVFVVSPWRDDLYYPGWEIKEGFLTVIPRSSHLTSSQNQPLIAQLLLCSAKCGREAKQWKKTASFVAAQPTGFMILQFMVRRAFDIQDYN